MADVVKITTLDKAKLHRPTRIPKYGTRAHLDADIQQHSVYVAQEARRLAAELAAAAAEQERLQAQSSPPLQQRDPAQAKATAPAKRARANTGDSSDPQPSKKLKPSKDNTDARRRDNSSKSTKAASKQPKSTSRPPAPARTETTQQKTRPAESAVGGSDKKAQDKSDKNAKAALTLTVSDSGNVPKGTSSSDSSGKKHQAASTAPPTTATAATSQSAQNEPRKPDKSTEPKAATNKSNTVTNLPRVPKKTSPMTLYTNSALHMVDLPSVTSEDSWNSIVSTLNETQKNELLNSMATFALDLQKVDESVNNKSILAPRRMKMREDLEALFAGSERLAAIPDFVHPAIISQGPAPAGYAGTGLGDVLNRIDKASSLDIWKHLRTALAEYYTFMTSSHNCQWHALAIAIVATLSAYQLCVNSAPELFPGAQTSDPDAAIPRPGRTRQGSGAPGPTYGANDATTSKAARA
jgi:hypothetical protein